MKRRGGKGYAERAGIDTNSKQYQAVILFCSLGEVGGAGAEPP